MIQFLLGYAGALMLVFGTTSVWQWTKHESLEWREALHGGAVFLFAIGVGWAGAELMVWWRRPRIFRTRVAAGLRRTARGVAAGLTMLVISAAGFVIVPPGVPDVVIVAGASFLSTGVFLLTTSRVRRGTCEVCGYPGEAGRIVCCECGHAHTVEDDEALTSSELCDARIVECG